MELIIGIVAVSGILIAVGVIGTLRAIRDSEVWRKECIRQRLRYWT